MVVKLTAFLSFILRVAETRHTPFYLVKTHHHKSAFSVSGFSVRIHIKNKNRIIFYRNKRVKIITTLGGQRIDLHIVVNNINVLRNCLRTGLQPL
jgi:hypothetical protein